MRVYRGFYDVPRFDGAVATVGSFDGVHQGHAVLLSELLKCASRDSLTSVVLTFEPHPRVVLGRADGLKLLMSLEEKLDVLEQMGVDCVIVIPFDREFSRVSYYDFVKEYLINKLGVSTIVVGYNHQIGRDSEGNYSSLVRLSGECGVEICRVDEFVDETEGCKVSSTIVRDHLLRGEITRATQLLQRPYVVMGRADDGGRVWYDEPLKLIPAAGRYAVEINGEESQIEIDDNGVVMCDHSKEVVVIRMSQDPQK
ncbi:MAG: FAD synthetase family protein [Rikenellaceae bacterium]